MSYILFIYDLHGSDYIIYYYDCYDHYIYYSWYWCSPSYLLVAIDWSTIILSTYGNCLSLRTRCVGLIFRKARSIQGGNATVCPCLTDLWAAEESQPCDSATPGVLWTETASWLFWRTHWVDRHSQQCELRSLSAVTRIHASLPFLAIESGAREYGKGTTGIYTLNHYSTAGVDLLSEGFDCTVVTELLVRPSLQELCLGVLTLSHASRRHLALHRQGRN